MKFNIMINFSHGVFLQEDLFFRCPRFVLTILFIDFPLHQKPFNQLFLSFPRLFYRVELSHGKPSLSIPKRIPPCLCDFLIAGLTFSILQAVL